MKFENKRIISVGKYIPKDILTNNDINKFIPENQFISKITQSYQ